MAVLAFHNTDPRIISGLNNFHPDRLRNSLIYLKQKGWRFPALDEYLKTENRSDEIVLTFDDGLESFYTHAFPILRELEIPAAVFIPFEYIGKSDTWDYTSFFSPTRHLSKEQLKILAVAGIIIGGHGLNHESLAGMGSRRLRQQLRISKEGLEDITGRRVNYLTYPFGRFNREIEEAAFEIGYKKGFSLSHFKKSPTGFTIPRFAVYAYDTPWTIANKTASGFLNGLEKIKGTVMNQYSGGTIVLNRIRGLFSSRH